MPLRRNPAMKKALFSLLAVLAVFAFCLPAAAAEEPPTVGVDGIKAVYEDGNAVGRGWEINYNHAADQYIMTLTEDHYTQITVVGDLIVNVPAGVTISLGTNSKNYGIGVTEGSLTINGSGTLNLIGTAALYGKESNITVNGPTVNASGTTYGALISNAKLTVNAGVLTATGTKYGVSCTGGIFVNGGTLNTASTKTDDEESYGIYAKNCPLRFTGGEITANGFYGIYNWGGQMSVSGASVSATAKESGLFLTELADLIVTDGTLSCSGGVTGIQLAKNSVLNIQGGSVAAKVSSGIYTNMTYGMQFENSDLLLSGGKLQTEGYYALSFSGLSDSAKENKNESLTLSGGVLIAKGNDCGLRFFNASCNITGGVLEAQANVNAGVYVYYSTFTVNGGTLLCDGGVYGINSYSATPVINGGTVFADGVKYGIFSVGKINIEGGNITAVGGTTGIAASGDYLTVGSAENARISLTAIGGSYALAGDRPKSQSLADPGVILFGRSYAYTVDLNFRTLRYVDGEEIYRSAESAVLRIDGVNVSNGIASGGVVYNPGGSASSYSWALRNNDGNLSLTLNGALLSSIELTGNLDIVLGNNSSRITDGISVTGGVLTLSGNSSLSVESLGTDAVTLTNSVLRQKNATLGLQDTLSALGSRLFLSGSVLSPIRGDVFNLNNSDIILTGAYINATDCSSVFELTNSDLQMYGSEITASGVSDFAVNGASAAVTAIDSKLTLTGAAGINVYSLQAVDSSFSVTAAGERGIRVRTDGLSFNRCTVQVQALEEAIYSEGNAVFTDTAVNATSNSGKRGVLLYAVPGSDALISVKGHCMIDSGKEPVRISDENGVISYFANGEVPLTTVIISNDHNYTVRETYSYCGKTGTKVLVCSFDGCDSTNCVATPTANHDYSNYVSNGDATCAKDGTKTATCPVCHSTETGRDVGSSAFVPHVFTKYISDKNGTCLGNGTKTATCDICGVAKDTVEEANSATGHTYNTEVIVPATCLNKGELKYTCALCGHSYTGLTEDYGDHGWTADSCGDIRVCRYCEFSDGAVLGHDFGTFEYDNNATCTEDGTKSSTCSRCKTSVKMIASGTKLGHEASDWIVVVPATAFNAGRSVKHCTREGCGETLETQVTARIVEATQDSGLAIDYEMNLLRSLPTNMTVAALREKLVNPTEVIFCDEKNVPLADNAIVFTGAIVKVTDTGAVFYAVVADDVSGDGQLNADDARLALRAAVGLESLNFVKTLAADVDADGEIKASDARTLLRRSVGLE